MYQFSPRPTQSSRIVLTVQLGRIYGERRAINLGSPPSRIQDIEKQRAERVQGRTPKVITNWGIITFPSPFAFPRKARRRGCSFPVFAGGEFFCQKRPLSLQIENALWSKGADRVSRVAVGEEARGLRYPWPPMRAVEAAAAGWPRCGRRRRVVAQTPCTLQAGGGSGGARRLQRPHPPALR